MSKVVRDLWLFFEAKRGPITKKVWENRLENLTIQILAGHDSIM